MNIKFVYFDIGGVLVDVMMGFRKVARSLNIDEELFIALFQKKGDALDRGRLSWADFEMIVSAEFNLELNQSRPLVQLLVDNFETINQSHLLAKNLSTIVPIGILSNVSLDQFKLIEEQKLLPSIEYHAIVTSGKLRSIKPESEIFEYAVKQAQFDPKEILFIDDNSSNIQAAKDLDWNTFQFDLSMADQSVQKISELFSIR